MYKQSGFTLIELMIVIAIIGIIAAVAVPQYHTYTNRTFVTNEGLNAARVYQLGITEYATTKQALPTSQADINISGTGETNTIASVSMATSGSADLTIEFKPVAASVPQQLADKDFTISPQITASGVIKWAVNPTLSSVADQYLPRM